MTTTDARQPPIGVDPEHPVMRIEEEHLTLRGQLDKIQVATTRAELHRDMHILPKMLLDHFAAEVQSGGLYDDLLKRCPALASELDALRDEHQLILDEFDAIDLRLNGQIESEPTVEVIPECKESSIIGDVYYTDEGGVG